MHNNYRDVMARAQYTFGLLGMVVDTMTRVQLMAMLLAYTQSLLVRQTSMEDRQPLMRTVHPRWLLLIATTLTHILILIAHGILTNR